MDSPTEPQKARHPQPRSIDLLQAALAAREDVYGDQSRTNSFASPYSPHSPISLHSPSLKSPSFADEKGISPIFPSETDLVSPTNGNKETSSSKFSRLRSYRNSIWSSKNGDEIPTGSEVPKVPELRSPTPAPEDPGPGLSKAREVLFVFNICLAQLFSLAGLAQSFAPLVILSDSFNVTDPGQMSWYTAAYSLTLGSFILPAGRLGDMFGHKRIFIIGWAWFAFWSLICGFSYAGGPIMLSACRAMQGIGPALLIPNGIALVGRRFPIGMKRNISIALFGGCGPVGIVSGAVGSSLFAQLVWWPWAFWFFAIACSVVGVLSIVAIPEDEGHAASGKSGSTNLRPKEKFDTLGAITGVSGLILINFAFNQAPLVDWSTPYIPVLMVAGILLMAVFVHVELHVAEKPLLPLRGLHRDAALTLTCIAAGWGSHGVWSYYQFLKWELYLKISPLSACSMFWPVAPVGFCAALAVPYILRKVRVPILMSAAMFFFMFGTILLVIAPAEQVYWPNTFISILIMPLAMNWSFPSGTILMSNAVSKQHQGIAASLVTTMVNYSISTGLGIAGSIDRYVTPNAGVWGGYLAAWDFGIALAALGLLISFYFIWKSRAKS